MARLTTVRTKWFSVPDDDDGAKIKVVHLKPGQVQDLEAQANPVRLRGHGSSMEGEITLDLKRKRELYTVAAVDAWEGFFSVDGRPMKCTPENKIKALVEFDWFWPFLEECREALAKEVVEQEGQAEKN